MTICIPIEKDDGLDSAVSNHFGSAPFFLLVDVETLACRAVPNATRQPGRGGQIVALLAAEKVNAVLVGGIGAGALGKLTAKGIRVFQTPFAGVKETLAAFKNGQLPRAEASHAHSGDDPRRRGPMTPRIVN